MGESLRTPLGRVRGHGAARSGTGHFIAQRVSAIALAGLAPWFVVSAALGLQPGYDNALAWVAQPSVAVPLILFVLAAFHHMRLGLSTIVEDYIHKAGARTVLLIGNTFLVGALAVASVFAILKISLGS